MTKGRFEGLTDAQWQVIEPLLPKEAEKKRERVSACSLEENMQRYFMDINHRLSVV